jgi:transposase-like protein
MGAPKMYKKEHILEAIKDSGAIVSTIARRLGCRWTTAKKYIQKWEETKRAFADEEETVLDMAESVLFGAVKDHDIQAAKWLLSKKAKARGYSDRIEHTGIDGEEIKITCTFVDPDDADDE